MNTPSSSSLNTGFLETRVNKPLLLVMALGAVIYFVLLAFWFPRGNPILFGLLIFGEIFHLWQVLGYAYTIWDTSYKAKKFRTISRPNVDVFITVAGEPVEIVRQTATAALAMDYPNFKVYLLNDGYVAKKDNWEDIEKLAEDLEITCITRTVPGGAKAGNINNGLSETQSPFVVVFDADHVPHPDFLKKMMPYFADKALGFVQAPQYYKNSNTNEVTAGAWQQQELFFGPICKGKNRLNSTFLCGTNMVIRRTALIAAGGMCETNIAEDFLTSLFIHDHGWKSVYVPEVLTEGLAPEDFSSYYKQQLRWARGSLEVIFKHNPLFKRGLNLAQKIQYLTSASYYLSGIVVIIDAFLPIIFFFTGKVPITSSTMTLAAVFLPYIFMTILILRISSNYSYTFRALSFSMGSCTIHIKALWAVVTNQKTKFDITAKQKLSGKFYNLVVPHIAYLLLVPIGLSVAVLREGLSAAIMANLSWALFNAAVFTEFISAASGATQPSQEPAPVVKVVGQENDLPNIPIPSFPFPEKNSNNGLLPRQPYFNKVNLNKKKLL